MALCANVTVLRYVFYNKIGRFISTDADDHLFLRFGNGTLYTNAITRCTDSRIIKWPYNKEICIVWKMMERDSVSDIVDK